MTARKRNYEFKKTEFRIEFHFIWLSNWKLFELRTSDLFYI